MQGRRLLFRIIEVIRSTRVHQRWKKGKRHFEFPTQIYLKREVSWRTNVPRTRFFRTTSDPLRTPGISPYRVQYVFKPSANTSKDRRSLRNELYQLTSISAARSLPFPLPTTPISSTKVLLRNHGYGKVEEDAAVCTNWYV